MAICIPDVAAESLDHNSEALLMKAFQDRLGDDYFVFHSFPWLYPGREDLDAAAREGEADFVLLHRAKGLLVIEAKGGEVVLKNRKWCRVVGGGRFKEIRDPAKQVRRACRALKDRIELICGEDVARQIRFATAVAFPHCVFRDEPPADLPARTILTLDDLSDIEVGISRAFGAFGAQNSPLTPADFDKVRKALAPEFAVYEPLKLGVDQAADVLARLTRQQLQILNGFSGNPRAIVHGVAGSGKTLLALARARRFAREGHRVLLTCFNGELAKWLAEQTAGDDFGAGTVTVRHFHGLAADILRQAGVTLEPVGDLAKYWDESVPDQMATAADALYPDTPPYTALVVDEAQDFSPGWWDALAYLTGLQSDVPTWAFLDRAQSLRREPSDPPLGGAPVLSLDFNCRNTRRVVAYASAIAHVPSEPSESAPLGRPPRLMSGASSAATAGIVQAEVRRLIDDHRLRPDQIALIGPAAWRNGSLSKWNGVAGTPIVESATEWRKGAGLLCTTARNFKGLEADVAILYDLHGIGPGFTESDLYVALTRARSHIILVTSQSEFAKTLEAGAAAVAALGEEVEAA